MPSFPAAPQFGDRHRIESSLSSPSGCRLRAAGRRFTDRLRPRSAATFPRSPQKRDRHRIEGPQIPAPRASRAEAALAHELAHVDPLHEGDRPLELPRRESERRCWNCRMPDIRAQTCGSTHRGTRRRRLARRRGTRRREHAPPALPPDRPGPSSPSYGIRP